MRRWIALLIVAGLLLEATAGAAVRGKSAKYVGGTISSIELNTKGIFDLKDSAALFANKKGDPLLTIPYERIESLEYGQKVGRRVGAALGTALVVSPLFLFLLFSKKRKHFLTIGFTDEQGKKQGALFELAKGTVGATLSTLESKSGKKIEYETEEARKHAEKQ
mgnify:CR=1 FL=1